MANFIDALCWVQKQYFQAISMKIFDWETLRNVTVSESDDSCTDQIAVLNAVCGFIYSRCFDLLIMTVHFCTKNT